MKNLFYKKTILITGGTGSFGKKLLKKILKFNFKQINILSRDEKKQEDLRNEINNSKIKFFIGDVRDEESMHGAFKGVDYIFHAAALKQVPSCEFYPLEAIKTNCHGTKNVINLAIKNKIKKMILLSTDKAVYPINSMGMSKALAEKIMIAKSKELKKNETTLCITRYGNVMNSRGSVIPLFINQIKNKKPLTITNPNMTRFMMSLDDSIDLVLHAFKNGNQGEIFVQKSPASTIQNLAITLSKIFNSKLKIKIIGIRHGEKNYETLISSEEMLRTISEKKYYKIYPDNRDLNYSKFFFKGNRNFSKFTEYNSDNTKKLNSSELKKLLHKININV